MIKQLIISLLSILSMLITNAQTDYSNYAQQSERITALSKTYPQLVKTKSLTKTTGGKDIWQITIGSANTESKPAIAIVGGVEGNQLLARLAECLEFAGKRNSG